MALTSDQITAQNFADFYTAIKPYLNGGGFQMKKLWENPDPTSDFSAQTITLNSSDYDMLLIIGEYSKAYPYAVSVVAQKGMDFALDSTHSTSSNCYRRFSYTTDTEISALAGYLNGSSNNTVEIPVVIYGIKLHSYDNISCVMMSSTWEAGETTVEFTDPIIDGDSIFDVYLPSQYADLIYSSLSVSGHTLTITFPSAQASDIEVKLRVNRG